MAAKTLTIDGKLTSAEDGSSILCAAREAGITIPTLCHLEGVADIGACRLCLVEIEGTAKLLPACTTAVAEGMHVRTTSERLHGYRRMILELPSEIMCARPAWPTAIANSKPWPTRTTWTTCALNTSSRSGKST
jgi:predicted molibdopterin-dependent oxidoreductase YjgC